MAEQMPADVRFPLAGLSGQPARKPQRVQKVDLPVKAAMVKQRMPGNQEAKHQRASLPQLEMGTFPVVSVGDTHDPVPLYRKALRAASGRSPQK